MTLYENGRRFRVAIRCCPPMGNALPTVQVEMVGAIGRVVSVSGLVDTGAFGTLLDFATAKQLGIDEPALAPVGTGTARTATDERVTYYMHVVWVWIRDGSGEAIKFPLRAAFADRLKRNLFGRDWLNHLCLAVDRQAVHFLRD